MMGISLVMATLGRIQEVDRFLMHLANQTCRNFELIVVDQNPDNRLVPMLDEVRRKGLLVIHLRQVEANQCKARNLGLSKAKYDWVAFPDDDCWYEPDVIEKVLAHLSDGGILHGVVARWEEVDPLGGQPHIISNALWRQFREVDASAITQFFQRQMLIQLGGFDPALGLHSWYGGGEETDLMFRVLAGGACVKYVPNIVVHHPISVPVSMNFGLAFKRARGRARGTGALYAKHHLSKKVIYRGLVAPLIRSIVYMPRLSGVIFQLGVALGRLEGWLLWPRDRNRPTSSAG